MIKPDSTVYAIMVMKNIDLSAIMHHQYLIKLLYKVWLCSFKLRSMCDQASDYGPKILLSACDYGPELMRSKCDYALWVLDLT